MLAITPKTMSSHAANRVAVWSCQQKNLSTKTIFLCVYHSRRAKATRIKFIFPLNTETSNTLSVYRDGRRPYVDAATGLQACLCTFCCSIPCGRRDIMYYANECECECVLRYVLRSCRERKCITYSYISKNRACALTEEFDRVSAVSERPLMWC